MSEKKGRYINPLTDFGFKKLFGTEPNKDLLIDFLNEIIRDRKIKDLTYSSNEHLGQLKIDRKAVFDIYCIGENDERFIVEMQKAKQNWFKDRSVFYASFPIQEQAQKGDWNYKLDAVYSIGVLDFVFDEHKQNGDILHFIELKDQKCEVFYEKLKFIYIELPKFKKSQHELKTHFDKWLYVFTHLQNLQTRPKALQERVFKKLFEAAEIATFSEHDRKEYEQSLKIYRDLKNVVDTARGEGRLEGRMEGRMEGKHEGRMEEKNEIARKLKNSGVAIELIVQTTGLSKEVIEKL